ncbi:nuclear transport factor 2-like isoform X1 [Carex rostrata]
MAATLFSSEDVAQVGNFFVTQYYNNLYKHPEEMYMFYKDLSSITRIDGNNVESATGMMEIHTLISAVKFSSIEIKTANFLRSYGDGLMAVVSGLVQRGQYEKRRKFIQAFFLAPQDSGYYILNDLFHYVDEEYFCNPDVLAQSSYENLTKSQPASEAVEGYAHDGQINLDEFLVPAYTHGNGNHSSYKYSDQAQHMASQTNCLIEETISSFSNATISAAVDSSGIAAPVDEPMEEPTRHTYASILKVGVSEGEQSVTYQPPVHRPPSANLEAQQQDWSYPSNGTAPVANAAEDYEVDSKSVYVKNVSRYFTEADLEIEFNKYGRLVPDGVAIRSHKETGRYYAFVEYEDSEGVENALKASPVVIGGWEMHVEERRPGTGAASRGRGRGRGGRFGGRGRGRSDGYRSRANGFDQDHHLNPEWGTLKNQSPRDGRHQSF